MNKDVIISLKGIQSAQSETNETELLTEGKYYKKGDTYYISYKESEMTGLEGTTTTIKVADRIITLMRFGSVNSQMIFEKGQKHLSYYETPYGAFTIGVLANQVKVELDDKGGNIAVDYQLEIDNETSGSNDFTMHVREAGKPYEKYDRGYQGAN